MNDLANLVQLFLEAVLGLLQPHLGPLQAVLAHIDGVSEQRTTCMDALGVTTFFQFDAFAFEELTDVFVKLVFLYWIHN